MGFGGTGGFYHAVLWHGSAASVVDLHPNGFVGSIARGVFEDSIVGNGTNPGVAGSRALLWVGAAHSVVNLHPAAFPQSLASDASQDSQVGTGIVSNDERHALLWHGTAASVIDLQPSGFTQTEANGVAGTLQVGNGAGTATGGKQHALLWQGSAASVVDLHSLLAGLGPAFVNSQAEDIDANGVIVGNAYDSNNVSYAVKWSPVVPGDYNGNGIVDAADYVVWRHTLNQTVPIGTGADGNGNATIDTGDYTIWRTSFGKSIGSAFGRQCRRSRTCKRRTAHRGNAANGLSPGAKVS